MGLNQACQISVFFTLIWVASFNFCVIGQEANKDPHHSDPNDPHGGVPMGIKNVACDDTKTSIEIDWDPNSSVEYTCTEERTEPPKKGLHHYESEETAQRPLHVCYPEEIKYTEDLPMSGAHRPNWPQYGEYLYLPVQRWLHNLEHGAVVFLYHPCANPEDVLLFKSVAKSCLWKHIISPYKKMPPEMNFALLAWKNKLLLSDPDVDLMVQFVKEHALQAPEGKAFADGTYNTGLIHHAKIVTDKQDSQLCPRKILMAETANEILKRSHNRLLKAEMSQAKLKRVMEIFMNGM